MGRKRKSSGRPSCRLHLSEREKVLRGKKSSSHWRLGGKREKDKEEKEI